MPVSYGSVLNEHHAVRKDCGLFDVSHMGELLVSGPKSLEFLQQHTINDLTKLSIGAGQYSAILNETGGMIDDVIVYRVASEDYFICVNASNIDKDFHWLNTKSKPWSQRHQVQVENQSDSWGQLAIQGPKANLALEPLFGAEKLEDFQYMQIREVLFRGQRCLLARTGYTGEVGFELYAPPGVLPQLWEELMGTSNLSGIKPIGLGARDTLRLEACYLLYGNDMNEEVSPLEAGIGWACKLGKGVFVGSEALVAQKAAGLKRQIFAFKMVDEGIPRHDMLAYSKDAAQGTTPKALGMVTSGSVLPTVGGAGGMALLDPRHIKVGDQFYVDIRGKLKTALVVPRPLYKAKVK